LLRLALAYMELDRVRTSKKKSEFNSDLPTPNPRYVRGIKGGSVKAGNYLN